MVHTVNCAALLGTLFPVSMDGGSFEAMHTDYVPTCHSSVVHIREGTAKTPDCQTVEHYKEYKFFEV
jgi:hypothetical protein